MKWGVGVFLLILAVFRIGWSWYTGVNLEDGDLIVVKRTVGFDLSEKWGRQWLTVKSEVGHREIQFEIPEAKKLNIGDKIEIVGTLEKRVITNSDQRFRLIISHFSVTPGTRNLGGFLQSVRQRFETDIRTAIGGDEGELLAGIILGDTGKLSWEATESFRRVGLAHVIAASGYNVGVIAGWIMALGILVAHRRLVILFVILCISLYMLIGGLQPAVVRAGVMGIMSMIGLLVGRKTDGVWGLAFSVLLLLIVNPLWFEDVSFQLSATAMVGVVTIQQPVIDKLRRRIPKFVAEGVGATLSAMIFTQPLIWHYFGTLSVVSPVVNGLVIWMVPLLMELGVMGMLLSLVHIDIGRVVFWTAWPVLRAFMEISAWIGNWTMASWQTGSVGWRWVVGYYGLIGVVYWRMKLKRKKKK